MVCANGDFVSITPEGELVQCPGVLARRYEALGGFVRWHGKPTTGTYDIALDAGQDRTRVLANAPPPSPSARSAIGDDVPPSRYRWCCIEWHRLLFITNVRDSSAGSGRIRRISAALSTIRPRDSDLRLVRAELVTEASSRTRQRE